MRITDIDQTAVRAATEYFYERISNHMDRMASTVANRRYSLPRVSRRRGHKELPYFYAVHLEELFDFARGQIQMQPTEVEERCSVIMEALYLSASGEMATPNWSEFVGTPLGLCILASGARMLLRQELPLNAKQVMLLASWTPKHLKRSGLIPIDPTEEEPSFHAEDIVDAFESLGIPV